MVLSGAGVKKSNLTQTEMPYFGSSFPAEVSLSAMFTGGKSCTDIISIISWCTLIRNES